VISARLDGGRLWLEMQDDGRGFSVADAASGNGISNLRSRAGQINASVKIKSEPGKGTTVRIGAPLMDKNEIAPI